MSGQLIGDNARADVFTVRKGKVLFRGNVTEHSRTVPTDLRGADGARNVVVAGCDVGHERTEGVKRCLVALLDLTVHVFADFVHRDVAGPLYERLHVLGPRALHEFAHRVKFGKLRTVVGVGDSAGAETVAQGKSHIVLGTDVADIVEVLVEETLLVVAQAPLRDDAAAAADHTTKAVARQVDVVATDTAVNGK